MATRPTKKKTAELLMAISTAIASKSYYFTKHADLRARTRRNVSPFEILRILKSDSKYHEVKKDRFNEEFYTWNYSIRGETLDAESVRIVISFEADDLLVITVINLSE